MVTICSIEQHSVGVPRVFAMMMIMTSPHAPAHAPLPSPLLSSPNHSFFPSVFSRENHTFDPLIIVVILKNDIFIL